MLPILTRRDAYYPLKYAPHGTHTAEPALLGNPLETVTGFLQAPAGSLHTQALHELARRDAHFVAEDAGRNAAGPCPRVQPGSARSAACRDSRAPRTAARATAAGRSTAGKGRR